MEALLDWMLATEVLAIELDSESHGPVRRPVAVRTARWRYLPRKIGSRFSRKDMRPSRASSEPFV